MTDAQNKETVHNYLRAWTEHNLDNLLPLLAPDFASQSPFSGRVVGKDKVAPGFKMLDQSFPDLKEEVLSMVAQGDWVACEVVETATFTGSLDLPTGTIAPTNRPYILPFGAFFRFNGQGLISEQRYYWDTAKYFQQLGIEPALFAPKSGPSKASA